jgi:hypothetical protein
MLPTPDECLPTAADQDLLRALRKLREQRVTLRPFAEFHEPRLNVRVRPAIPNAVKFSAFDCVDHAVELLGVARLLGDEAMLIASRVVADGEEIGCFCTRHVTERAAAVFDVEVAGDVSRMRALLTHFTPPNGLALSCEPQRLRGPTEAPTFDARRYHGSIGTCCGSSAALCWAARHTITVLGR